MLKSTLLKNSMNFGLITALIIVIFNLIFYIILPSQQAVLGIITYLILFILLIVGTKHLRDNYLNGYISYSKSVTSGVLISLFVSLIIAFYVFVFFKVIDPQAIDKIIEVQEEELYKRGTLSETQIESSIEIMRKITTPTTLALGTIFNYTLVGTLFSLIISAFIKKDEPEYQKIIREIEENEHDSKVTEQSDEQ